MRMMADVAATRAIGAPVTERKPGDRAAVVILCPNAWSVRNIVHAGTVDHLRERGLQIHVLSPAPRRAPAAPDCLDPGATHFREWKRGRPPRGKALADELLRVSFHRRHHLRSRDIFDRWERRNDALMQRTRHAALRLAGEVAHRQPFFGWQRWLEEWFLRRARDVRAAARQLEALSPALIVSTSSASGIEWPYVIAARDLGVPTLGCILSFDNLTSRSVLPLFDHYAVWNERMRDRVLQLYPDRDARCVAITGSPQFDFHRSARFRWTRERTVRFLGVPDGARYLLYGANSARLTPSEPALVALLARCMRSDPVLGTHHLIVRLHPLDDFDRWQKVGADDPLVRISRPWRYAEGTADPDDQAQLVSTLLHADASINIASTMSLDGAALDTPVVCPAFAVTSDAAEQRFMRELYETDHFAPITESGGVRMVRDMEQLLEALGAYVLHRDLDGHGRKRLFALEGGWRGAPAAERLAENISALVLGPRSAARAGESAVRLAGDVP